VQRHCQGAGRGAAGISSQAADRLGISKRTLQRKIKTYGAGRRTDRLDRGGVIPSVPLAAARHQLLPLPVRPFRIKSASPVQFLVDPYHDCAVLFDKLAVTIRGQFVSPQPFLVLFRAFMA